MDLFVVDFEITTTHQKRHTLLLFINKTKNMSEAIRYYSS